MSSPPPRSVAAVVINHNGGDDLARCLAALATQSMPVRVVLVDCGSSDGSDHLARRPPPGVEGVPLEENRGYTGGANAGLEHLAGGADAVGFFNPDCFVQTEFFARCLETLEADPGVGGLAPRLVRPGGETLDSCGQVLSPAVLRVRDRGYGEPAADRYLRGGPVLAACGAGMVYRRQALEAVWLDGAVFPDEFFAFWEDLDLGWRVWNSGWRVVYEPRAVAVHRRGATAAFGTGRMIFRRPAAVAAGILANRWATLVRNLHVVDFLPRLPLLLAMDAAMVTWVLCRRPAVGPHLLRSLRRLAPAWRLRRATRRRRLRDLP